MSNYKELLKHSGNYMIATLATKALAFISIPVYTYLLTVEEYGIFNVFLSTVGIATVLLTLNTEVAISRYYYDATDETDFKRFVGTSVRLSGFVFLLMSVLMVLCLKPLSLSLEFERLLTLSIIPVSLYNIVNSIFQQIYQPLLQSRKIAIVSSVQAYLAFGLSVLAILMLDDKKYYGQVYGTIAAMFLVGSYSFRQIKPYYMACFDKKYIKYILSYSLPYLPYSLSGIIIAQFGKLIIGQQQGFESAGLYSFASNIAMLMMILITVVHSAWNPYYFTYMNAKNYKQIDKDYDLIWRITLVAGGTLSIFGYELGELLGKQEYLSNLFLIPILVLGYCFYQWSYVYLRNFGYAKKTIWNAAVVITSGVTNVFLNSLLITPLNELGVAISFAISYCVMLIMGMIVNRKFLRIYTPLFANFMKPFLALTIVIAYAFYKGFHEYSIVWLILDVMVFLLFTIFIMRKLFPVLSLKKYDK